MSEAPLYAAGEPGSDRRIQVISYHFPPGQAAGALRWEKLAHHAADHEFGLDVLTLDPEQLPSTDVSRLRGLPAGTRVFGVPARAPALRALEDRISAVWKRATGGRTAKGGKGLATHEAGDGREDGGPAAGSRTSVPREEIAWWPPSGRLLTRTYYAWVEHVEERGWALAAARKGERLARAREPDLLVSCGPPHMAHEGARRLAARLAVPFVVDLRDPWSLQERVSEHVASPLRYALARRYERRCVREASLVVCNTQPASEAMQEAHPEAADRVVTILNGYDDEPLPSSPPPDGTFVIAYAGTIYIDRTPRPLFAAVRRVVRDLGLGPGDLRVELIGNVDSYGGTPITEMARQEGVAEHVLARPFLPRPEALSLLARASLLVSLPQDSHLAIPSKIYEYMRFPAWLLAMAEERSATGRLLRPTGADLVPSEDVEALADVIRRRYEAFRRSGRPSPIADHHPELSRERQAEKLFEELDRIASGARGARAAADRERRASA